MRVIGGVIVGMIAGGLGGAAIGFGIGFAWISLARTSCFEGYCAMLLFFSFTPAGMLAGAVLGAIWFGLRAARDRRS